jgi:hypothetical protein
MTSVTLFCWLAWLVVLFYMNPDEGGVVGFTMFYLSLFLALIGTFSLLGFFIRVWFSKETFIFRHLGVATRQSLWFSILLIVTLMFQGGGMLKWWSALLLVLFLVLMEFFFITRKVARY